MEKLMKALWLEDGKLTLREDVEIPTPASGEALLRVLMAGICATDLEMVSGYYPFSGILGHEFVGEVIAAPGYPAWNGQRVVGEINVTCGVCQMCRSGLPTHCERRSTLGIVNRQGVFADYCVLPLENLHRVPDDVPNRAAVFTEPLAAALQILEQVSIRPSERVVVLGAGRLGQLIAQVLALTGCDLSVVARHAYQQELLARRGIHFLPELDVTGRKYDIVVEATGSPEGFSSACQVIRPRGVLVLKSTYAADIQVRLSPLVVDEVTLVGSRCGPFAPALRLLEEQRVDPTPLVVARYPLEQAIQALEYANQPGILKVLLDAGG
jgi:threonine dehydrogenase-like Zn-dependent dehydrogenase